MRSALLAALLGVAAFQAATLTEQFDAAVKRAFPDATQTSPRKESTAVGTTLSWRYSDGELEIHYWLAPSAAEARKTLSDIRAVYPAGVRRVAVGDEAFVVNGCTTRCTLHFTRGSTVVEVRAPSKAARPCAELTSQRPGIQEPCGDGEPEGARGLPPLPTSKESGDLSRAGFDQVIRFALLADAVIVDAGR